MNICRVCMESGEESGSGGAVPDLIPIFSKLEDAFIANILVECTSVQILEDDGLPTTICQGCVDSLKSFIRFIRKARESDRKLRKMFKSEGAGKRTVEEAEADEEDDKNWTSAMELSSVFTESIMEVKEELESDDGKDAPGEAAYEVEYLDDVNVRRLHSVLYC